MKKINYLFWPLAALTVAFTACEDETAVSTTNPAVACLPAPLQGGLIAAYPFASGTFTDAVGSADLTFSNVMTASDRDGNAGCAVQFGGDSDSYLMTQDTQWLNDLDEFSVALWYQPLGTQNGYELLIGRGDGFHCPDTHGEWSVGLYDLRKAVFGHGNSVWEETTASGVTNAWKFLTVTCDKSDNTIKLYINGQLMDSKTGFANCGSSPVTVSDVGNLMIGQGFNGKIDDIVIYNKVLTPGEIGDLFEVHPCCAQ